MLQEYWASTVIFIGIFSQCIQLLKKYILYTLTYSLHIYFFHFFSMWVTPILNVMTVGIPDLKIGIIFHLVK